MKKLVAGPWIGEFGWELMSWQGYIRKQAEQYDEVVVCAPESSRALYSDFITGFFPYTMKSGAGNCWGRSQSSRSELLLVKNSLKKIGGTILSPTALIPITDQKFIKFGKHIPRIGFDVVVHARRPFGRHPERAYPQAGWDVIVRRLLDAKASVVAIGTDAFLPEGAVDMRYTDLPTTTDILASSGFIAGPASGPTLLSMLCKTPVLAWTNKRYWSAIKGTDRERIEKIWNPFGVSSIVSDELGWDAKPDQLMPFFFEALKRWQLP